MSQTVADVVLERLRSWGVQQVFGYPGDGINGLLAAFAKADDTPSFIQSRHEEMSALQAVGFAKFSGEVGVCTATSGPGAIHLLNGLYDAKADHVPVVALVGQTERSAMGGAYQQEVDLLSLFKDVCSEFVQVCTVPQQIPNLIDRAFRVAMTSRTPTCVIFPSDVQELDYEPPEHAFKQVPSSLGISFADVVPRDEDLRRVADLLNDGKKVAMLVGAGARGAADEIRAVADVLGAGVAKALLGKDVIGDDEPFVTGAIGLLGTKPSYDMMMDCDTLLTVGSSFPYSQFLPPLDQARAVQVDIDGRMLGMRYPYELNVVGDAKETLRRLLPLLTPRYDRSWRQEIEEGVTRWWEVIDKRAHVDAAPVNPQRLFWELSQRMPNDAIIAADSGSAANWYARHLKFSGDVRGSLSGTLATMGPAVPYAIGAKFAHPDRPVIAFEGDGAMQMNGLAELITIAHYRERWSDQRLIVAVLHNDDLNQVTWEMRGMGGTPKFAESQTLPDVDYAAFARGIGLHAIRVERPEDVGPAWDAALAADVPTVIDCLTSGDVPPIPPHATFEQVKNSAKAVLSGDEDAVGVVKTGLKSKVQEFLP